MQEFLDENLIDASRESSPSYAPFTKRLLAFIIDDLLLLALGRVSAYSIRSLLIFEIIKYFLFWLYLTSTESGVWQATFGKRLLKIKVVGNQESRISLGRASMRSLVKVVTAWIVFYVPAYWAIRFSLSIPYHGLPELKLISYTIICIGGYIFYAFQKQRKEPHDLIAGTLVINDF